MWGQEAEEPIDETNLLIADTENADIAEDDYAVAISPTVGVGDVARMILVLIFVIGLIYGLYRFLRKVSPQQALNSDFIQVLTSRSLEPGRNLHVIEVGTDAFLVGSTDGGIQLIGKLNDKEAMDRMRLAASKETPVESFSAIFSKWFKREDDTSPPLTESAQNSADFIKKQQERLKKLE